MCVIIRAWNLLVMERLFKMAEQEWDNFEEFFDIEQRAFCEAFNHVLSGAEGLVLNKHQAFDWAEKHWEDFLTNQEKERMGIE